MLIQSFFSIFISSETCAGSFSSLRYLFFTTPWPITYSSPPPPLHWYLLFKALIFRFSLYFQTQPTRGFCVRRSQFSINPFISFVCFPTIRHMFYDNSILNFSPKLPVLLFPGRSEPSDSFGYLPLKYPLLSLTSCTATIFLYTQQ